MYQNTRLLSTCPIYADAFYADNFCMIKMTFQNKKCFQIHNTLIFNIVEQRSLMMGVTKNTFGSGFRHP